MNSLAIYAIISAIIGVLVYVTRTNDPQKDTLFSVSGKTFIISFVCIYAGMTFLTGGASLPEIDIGEPDF